ncbi:hypothetical protein D3C76_554060 [compost metagenome]
MKNDRNQLLTKQIPKFQIWLDENGIVWRKPKGEYQVLQIKLNTAWAAICTNAQGVISTPPALREMIARFKKGLPFTGKAERVESSTVPYEAPEDLTDLRDDFAIAALKVLLTRNDGRPMLDLTNEAYYIANMALYSRSEWKRSGRSFPA